MKLPLPIRAALVAASIVTIFYLGLVIYWAAVNKSEPDGGWDDTLVSAMIQVAGWSFLCFFITLVWTTLHRRGKT